MAKQEKRDRLQVPVTEAFKKRVEKASEADDSTASYVRKVLDKDMKGNGI
jgi:hypothetical protein